jgi:hypothetical protein
MNHSYLPSLFFLFLCVPSHVSATSTLSGCQVGMKRLVQSLEPTNEVRRALEQNNLGDGVHHAWMDNMRRHGVQRVDFDVEFSIVDGRDDLLTIRAVSYYKDYAGISEITVNRSETAQDDGPGGIRYTVISELKAALWREAKHEGLSLASGHLSYSLFDDECIPRLITNLVMQDPQRTPLMLAAAEARLDTVKNLISKGTNVNIQDENGDTALLLASGRVGASEIVDQLLKSGADPNAPNREGETALMWAAFADDINTVNVLLENGSSASARNRRGESALQWALSKSDLSTYTHDGESAGKNTIAIVRALVGASANVNSKDVNGITPLIQATRSGLLPAVRELISLGADVDAQDNQGRSALDYATEHRLSKSQVYDEIVPVLRNSLSK